MNLKALIISFLFVLIAGIAIGFLLCGQCAEKPVPITIIEMEIDSIEVVKISEPDTIFKSYVKTNTIYKDVYIETSSTFSYADISESKTFTDIARESSTFSAYEFTGYLDDSLTDETEYPVNFIGTNLFLTPPFKSHIDTEIEGNILRLGFRLPGMISDSLWFITKSDTLSYHNYLKTTYFYETPWYHEAWFEITKDLFIAAVFSYIGTQVK